MSLPVLLYKDAYCTDCYSSAQVFRVEYNTPFSPTEYFVCANCGVQQTGAWATRVHADWVAEDEGSSGSELFTGPWLSVHRNAPKGLIEELTPEQRTYTTLEKLGAAIEANPKAWRVWPTRHRTSMEPYYRVNTGPVYWLARGMHATVLHGMWRHARKRCR